MLKSVDDLFERPFKSIVIVHRAESSHQFNVLQDERITLLTDIPADIDTYPKPCMFIFDDVYPSIDDQIKFSTRLCHHSDIFYLLTTHNLYNERTQTLRRNLTYLFFFSSPQDRSVLQRFASSYRPGKSKFIIDAYEDAINSRPYGYLFFDMSQAVEERLRVRSNVLNEGYPEFAYECL